MKKKWKVLVKVTTRNWPGYGWNVVFEARSKSACEKWIVDHQHKVHKTPDEIRIEYRP